MQRDCTQGLLKPNLDSKADEIKIPSRQKAMPKLVLSLVSLTTGDGIGHINKCHFSCSLLGASTGSSSQAVLPLTVRPLINEILVNSGLRVFMDQ